MSSKSKLGRSGIPKSQSKPHRSFLPRLPSFRRKKSASPKSTPEKSTLPIEKCKEEPIPGSIYECDNVMRRSKTSELVASFEKRLSDMKDEEEENNKSNDLAIKSEGKIKSPPPRKSKFSRFGFKGIAAHHISRFENKNNNGNGEKAMTPEENSDEINDNSPVTNMCKSSTFPTNNKNKGDRSHDKTDNKRTGSTNSAKSPDSACSSPSSVTTCTKVLGLPMPYRSIFSDEPRGLKRQASSQSVEPLSSGISTASMSSTPSPCLDTMLSVERVDNPQTAMLNTTFSLSEPQRLNGTFNKDAYGPCNATFTKDDASGPRISESSSPSKTKEKPPVSGLEVGSTSQQENVLSLVKETVISHSEPMLQRQHAVETDGIARNLNVTQQNTGSPGVSLGHNDTVECHPVNTWHRPDLDTQHNTRSNHNRLYATTSASEQTISSESGLAAEEPAGAAMGSTQSALEPNAISTPARPLHLSLKTHLSAINHAGESYEYADLDSLASDDLMCDSRYLEDDAFDQIGEDDSSQRLSRSAGMDSVLSMQRHHNGWGNKSQTSSLDQTSNPDKRVSLSRGFSISSPIGVTPRSKRRGARPASRSVSAVDELTSLISTTVLTDRQQFGTHNTNRNRSNSSLTSTAHPLRPPRWLSHQDDSDEDVVEVDAVVYRHMIQDITYLKTMLLRLKRALQQTETFSPFEHPLRSPFSSVPSSPMSDTYHLGLPDSAVADLTEENQVLRKEVKKLQELLVDKQSDFNSLSKKLAKPDNRHTGTQCEAEQPSSHCASGFCGTDKCLQVDLPLNAQLCTQQEHHNTVHCTFYTHQQQQQQMEQQPPQQQQQYTEQQEPQCQFDQPLQQDIGDVHLEQDIGQYTEEDVEEMTPSESVTSLTLTSSTSSLTSEETRSSCRSLSSPSKSRDIPTGVDIDFKQQQRDIWLQEEEEEQQYKELSDDSLSENMQQIAPTKRRDISPSVDIDLQQQQRDIWLAEEQQCKESSDSSSSENMQQASPTKRRDISPSIDIVQQQKKEIWLGKEHQRKESSDSSSSENMQQASPTKRRDVSPSIDIVQQQKKEMWLGKEYPSKESSDGSSSENMQQASPTQRRNVSPSIDIVQQQKKAMWLGKEHPSKESSDGSLSENMQHALPQYCEIEQHLFQFESAEQDNVKSIKLSGSSQQQCQAGSPKKEASSELTQQSRQKLHNEPKQVMAKKKQTSKSRLMAPSSVSSKMLSTQERKANKGKDADARARGSIPSRGVFKKQAPVTEIQTIASTSWEPLVDSTSSSKNKLIVTQSNTSQRSGLPMSRGRIQPSTAYGSYQQKSGLRAPSQRVNQMNNSTSGLQPPKSATHHSSCGGSNERLSEAPASPKRSSPRSSPQHSLRSTLAQPVPSKLRTGLSSPKRARQIPMGVTQMQSQLAASNQNKSPKRSANGSRQGDVSVIRPGKSQEQVWEKQMNGSRYSPEHVMRGVTTSPQRQIRNPGSKIAIPVRGRGESKLPRTSIPARRIDQNM